VAVGGDEENRHGIILAKNWQAKTAGVKTGEAIWEAKEKCPALICVPAHYDLYLRHSALARAVYGDYTDRVEPFGADECWLDLTGCVSGPKEGKRVADEIRERIRRELGITASVGVSFNKIFAKLGSDMKKPDATTTIFREEFRRKVWPLQADEMIYVGPATRRKLLLWGIRTLGELAAADPEMLRHMLGKNGVMLWQWANGLEYSPVREAGASPPVKSVGNSMTTPKDVTDEQTLRLTLYLLSESVAARLREHGFRCGTVQVWLRDRDLSSYERQVKLPFPVEESCSIFDAAWSLARRHPLKERPLRSVGVRACGLIWDGVTQMDLDPAFVRSERTEELERTVDSLRNRFGEDVLFRALMLADRDISGEIPKRVHLVHAESYFR
jgi:DNA polymerase-4